MLRFIARVSGLWLLAAALVALVVDGARTISAAEPSITPLGKLWQNSMPATFAAAEAATPGWLWDPVMLALLEWPVFAVFLALGALLLWVGQRARPVLPEVEVGR